MNKQGREQLVRAAALLDEARSIGLQAAERGQRMEEVVSSLAEQVEAIGDVLTALEEAQE